MARDASFIRQFIADFWDLLPKEDLDLMGAYWHALTMAIADLYNEAFETALATTVQDVQVFRTERWNRYQITDLESTIESLTLTGTTPVSLANDAVMFDSLVVTNTAGSIFYSETITLVGTGAFNLKHGSLVDKTVRVSEGGAIFLEGRDYNLNKRDGQISRTELGGIPTGTTVTVSYMHSWYKRDADYAIDEVNRTIVRVSGGEIASGDTVRVSYDYDALEATLLTGIGAISATSSTLTDESKDLTGVMAGRTLTIASGANAGTYTVLSVVSPVSIKITGSFVSDDPVAAYTINAFPYAISVDTQVVSIPTMQNLIVDPTEIYREGVDYQVGAGRVSFRSAPPVTRTKDGPTLWAEETKRDEQTVYRNFGVLIDFYRESSQDYLNAVKGLWYTYWTGSTHENLLRGLNILLGLPFATEPTTVYAIELEETEILDVSASGDISPERVRTMPTGAGDTITGGSPGPGYSTVYFSATTIDYAFTATDVARKLRIIGSGSGNDGYYVIDSIISASAVSVVGTLTNEATGFTGRVYEADPVDTFEYAYGTFTIDDIGRTLRISNSSAGNDGDYVIGEIVNPYSCRIELPNGVDGFSSEEGAGFTAVVVEITDKSITLSDADGVRQTFSVPSGLQAIVAVGDELDSFHRLTTGVRIIDKEEEPGFVTSRLGRFAIQRFLTQNASKGSGATDETKALTLLEQHLWIPQVLVDASSGAINTDEIVTFLENLKPQWTEYVFSFAADFDEQLSIGETLLESDISLAIDLTTILRNSWPNIAESGQAAFTSTTGEISDRVIRYVFTTLVIAAPSYFSAADGAFTNADVGRILEISSSGASNDGLYTIDKVLSSTEVLVSTDLDFQGDESGGFTASINGMIKLYEPSTSSFSFSANIGDVILIESGANHGAYRVSRQVDDSTLLVSETDLDGPFKAAETGVGYDLISNAWAQDQGSLDLIENFLIESDDGAASGASTFTVMGFDLEELGVQPGFVLVIKSGANMDVYDITAVPGTTQVTISGTFPSSPTSSEDYAICQAATKRMSGVTILEVTPI